MSVRPLPGASYHTVDNFFHSFDYLDLEAPAVDNNTPTYGASEKKHSAPFHERKHAVYSLASPPHSGSRGRHYRGPPVLLSVIILCCLAFVASGLWEYSSGSLPLPKVPDRHAPLANHLSSAFQTQSFKALVNEHYNGALEMTGKTFECGHDGCGEYVGLRHYLLQTFPLEHPSVHQTLVGDSAVVLHWQGTDSNLKPVLITNSDAVLASATGSTLPRPDNEIEHFEELADVQSGVGALIASDVLLHSGYQPSRTLVFSLMLGDASDALKVSEYLHDTYGELGLNVEFNPPGPKCRNKGFKVLRVFHTVISRVSRAVSAIFFIPSLGNDVPRLFRYTFNPAMNQAMLTKLRIQATDAWVRLILGADWN